LACGKEGCPASVGIHGLELAAVDGNAIALQCADPAAELDELRADLADARAVVAPEVRDGLVIRHQLAGKPHDLDIAARLALQPAALRDAVQVFIDEQLEQVCGMIGGPSRPRGGRANETETFQIKLFYEEIHDPNEAILTDPVVQPFRKKHRLTAINALDETRHARPTCGSLPQKAVSTQPRPKLTADPPVETSLPDHRPKQNERSTQTGNPLQFPN
jgi:hypothetical protein